MLVTPLLGSKTRLLGCRSIAALLMTAFLVAALPQSPRAAPSKFVMDPDHMTVGFLVTHIGFARVFGLFREAGGSFVFDEDSLSLGDLKVVVQTDSVWSNHEKRDQHLRSDAFLDTGSFPQMTCAKQVDSSSGSTAWARICCVSAGR